MRYDRNVPAGAKLLYGEISTLCSKEGYCWAGNAYFAELYHASERTIINWINALSKAGHITAAFKYVPGKKEIQTRFLRLAEAESSKIARQEKQPPADSRGVVKNSSPRGEKNFTTYGKNFHEVVKNPSKGGEKNFMDNTTSNNTNNKTTTAAASPDPQETASGPPPAGEKAAEGVLLSQELKNAFAALDKRLIFNEDFYPNAVSFMAERGLDSKYLSWLYEQCELKEPHSFNGYFFSLFFLENKVEEFKLSLSEKEKPPPDENAPPAACPACGNVHARRGDCPACGLPWNPSPEQILFARELHSLPPDKRGEYLRREENLLSGSKTNIDEINKLKTGLASLRREFGLPAPA